MKLRRARIENFKKFSAPGVEIDFHNSALGEVADRFLILGDNASGKTTVLQAVALTLSLAQNKTHGVGEFGWTGWMADRFLLRGDPVVELEVEFEDDEIAATHEAARRWWDFKYPSRPEGYKDPGDSRVVLLRLEGTRVTTPRSERDLYQFQGRSYVAAAARSDPKLRKLFDRLPGVFWYDQFRNISLPGAREPEGAREAMGTRGRSDPGGRFLAALEPLEDILKAWFRTREARGPHSERDFFAELGSLYSEAFPGRRLDGLEQVFDGPTPAGDRFVLSDGHQRYALAEMSSGEQAVFPILFEFVRQQIHRSVVLIDEIDLNLHPPLAQAVLGMLPRLGRENQFLFTTHSRAVSALVSPHAIFRLPEGRPCL